MTLEQLEATMSIAAESIAEARKEGKMALVDFYTEAFMRLFNEWQTLKAVAA